MDPRPIAEIAARLGLTTDDYEPYGWYRAKLALGLESRLQNRPLGKYVLVTAISPTPPGEGKTVTTIGLSMALNKLGRKAVATLRQPSLAPVFGIKGGGAGGGNSALLPKEDVNMHLTGDMHAVAAANNLLAAMIDNHIRRGKTPALDPDAVTWRRVLDMSDKGLLEIETGLAGPNAGPKRRTGFDLTAASEVMAVLALCSDLKDLRRRLGRIVVGAGKDGKPVTAEDIRCAGAMTALLRDAIRPNLVQTAENTPAFVHAGPFGNIAHGNCSILSDRAALRLADYVVTEAGFGADLGAEKFFDIKCRVSGLRPDAAVLVCSVRAVKWHSGRYKKADQSLHVEDLDALRAGASNLAAHLDIVKGFGVPVVVAVNHFGADSRREVEELLRIAVELGAEAAAVSDVFENGGDGGLELARAVEAACRKPADFKPLYADDLPPAEKFRTVAKTLYGASDAAFSPLALEQLARFTDWGFGALPVCVAKTQSSLSHDPSLLGRPKGFTFPIRDVRLCAGAGFLYGLAGDIMTMPGLPAEPAARGIDVDGDGRVVGMR